MDKNSVPTLHNGEHLDFPQIENIKKWHIHIIDNMDKEHNKGHLIVTFDSKYEHDLFINQERAAHYEKGKFLYHNG